MMPISHGFLTHVTLQADRDITIASLFGRSLYLGEQMGSAYEVGNGHLSLLNDIGS